MIGAPMMEEVSAAAAVAAAAAEPTVTVADPMAVALAKAQLLDMVYGTARGLDANLGLQVAVDSLLASLEDMHNQPGPAAALQMLDGRWAH